MHGVSMCTLVCCIHQPYGLQVLKQTGNARNEAAWAAIEAKVMQCRVEVLETADMDPAELAPSSLVCMPC